MPQLSKGGKWIFGWVVVNENRKIRIPPEAFSEYGFCSGEVVLFTHGSRTSGGFSLGRQTILLKNEKINIRSIAKGILEENMVIYLPPAIDAQPGERLLAVRGSRFALGFIQRGPIYTTALHHTDIEVFTS